MLGACARFNPMGKGKGIMIQVRSVPAALHRELVRRARARGQTLTEYVQGILQREVRRPPVHEVFARIAAFPKVDLGMPASEVIRQARAERMPE